ncbi:MAG: HAD family hydrolase [Thermomicrobiales bacterium]|nr:HAD family hydrolase [Thermomicrobiales bacterium]
MMTPALFLDRDGTLVHPRHYPARPEELVLYDGIGSGLRRLQAAGFRLVLITNQAGIARGYFSEADLDRMHAHLRAELAALGVALDAIYYCPHHIEGAVAPYAHACDCRKPAPGMLLHAAIDLDLDLDSSWFLGDILDDVEAGNRAGCRTVLIDLGSEAPPTSEVRRPTAVARNTVHALEIVAAAAGLAAAPTTHVPARWREEAVHVR